MFRFAMMILIITSTSVISNTTAVTETTQEIKVHKYQPQNWWNMPDSLSWVVIAPNSTPCWGAAGAYLNGKYYQVCGSTWMGISTYKWAQIWDGSSWSQSVVGHPNGVGICEHGCCVLNNKIIVGGGEIPNQWTDYTSVYDPTAGTWNQSTPMAVNHLGSYGMAACNGKVYIFGGVDTVSCRKSVYEWTPGDGAMVQKADMPYLRAYGTAATYNNKIYFFGGSATWSDYVGSATILEFTPSSNTWLIKNAALTGNRIWAVAVTIGAKIYIIGGMSGSGALTTVDIYDPVADTTIVGPSLLHPTRSEAAAGSVLGSKGNSTANGVIFVSGGTDGSDVSYWNMRGDVTGITMPTVQPTSLGLIKAVYR